MTPQLQPESPLTTAARVATATTCKSGDGSLLRSIPCAEPGSTLERMGHAHTSLRQSKPRLRLRPMIRPRPSA